MKYCNIGNCSKVSYQLSMCCMHYTRQLRHGSVNYISREYHGKKGSPEYRSWQMMKYRCYNTNCVQFDDWGGRGIKVCDRWLNSFANFLGDMGERPTLAYSLDRIDNNGDYTPDNCRWATKLEQNNNRRPRRYRKKPVVS